MANRRGKGPRLSKDMLDSHQKKQILLFVVADAVIVLDVVLGLIFWMNRQKQQDPLPQSPTLSGEETSQSVPEPSQGSSQESSSTPESSSGQSTSSYPDGGWSLILINKQSLLPEDYSMDLVTVRGGQQVDVRIFQPLSDMLSAARAQGYSVSVMSGYRSPATSQALIDEEVQQRVNQGMDRQAAYEEVIQAIAPPYTSEHNAGLAVDIYAPCFDGLRFEPALEYEPEYRWLKEHCAEYGFILRYPKDKVSITQYQFEPWHFRYVGKEAAQAIMSQGICLEEYLGQA